MHRVQLQAICKPIRCLNGVVGIALALLLAACGGGGGGGGGSAAKPVVYSPSSTLANQCVGTTGRADLLAKEKDYIRSFVDETYLWYRDIPASVVAANYSTPQLFFDALKTYKTTNSGAAVDQFHWSQSTASWAAASAGTPVDYGIEWVSTASRVLMVANVASGSPAAAQGVKRGDRVTMVDGIDILTVNTDDGSNSIYAALLEDTQTPHRFVFNSGPEIILTPGQYTLATVHDVNIFTASDGGKVGYFIFDSHLSASEADLIAAVNYLKSGEINDLVIDLRYNGGGVLYIASQLAYMIAGHDATNGKTFERAIYNDKLTAKNTDYEFLDTTFYTQVPLPSLDLPRVTLLVTRGTASASESIINSLRGVGVRVNLIGATTRGKPYGFVPQDNCGTTYFAIQFKGVNNLDFGDYADGFAPTCTVSDDLTRARGNTSETMLSAALYYRLNNSCPVVSSAPNGFRGSGETFGLVRRPSQEMRIVTNRPHL